MNWEAIGAVAEILAAMGVLASLVYVASQIRDNTRSLQAASLQSVLDGSRDRTHLPMAIHGEASDIFARGLNSLGTRIIHPRSNWFRSFDAVNQMMVPPNKVL